MTPAQLTTLKAAILAETDPAFVALRDSGATGAMADWFNVVKSPAVKAWNSNVQPQATDEATPWTAFDAITPAGKRDSYLHAFMRYPRDYSKNAVRKWITDVWGNATVGSNAETILLGAGVRDITRGEAVLGGSNTGTTNAVTALKLAFEGSVTNTDIVAVVNA